MKMLIIVISTCLGNITQGSLLHFKGYYLGKKINKILLKDVELKTNSDYMLWAKVIHLDNNGLLVVKMQKVKELIL